MWLGAKTLEQFTTLLFPEAMKTTQTKEIPKERYEITQFEHKSMIKIEIDVLHIFQI